LLTTFSHEAPTTVRAYLQQVLYRISGSYWFIPTLMVLGAMLLSQFSIWIDREYGDRWLRGLWLASLNQPDGARALLATVAGSMITVAGVTFSLTILAVSHASTHFGPRLLDNFMHDRGNQVTLGTFVATFLYCLMVLRVVRGEDVIANDGLAMDVFVPQLSLLIAFLLTLGSIAELIYFIHHVPDSIHISSVLRRLSIDVSEKLTKLYPERMGASEEVAIEEMPRTFEPQVRVPSHADGYLQGIDDVELINLARKKESIVRLVRRPGDFIRKDEIIAEINHCEGWTEKDSDTIRHAFTIGFTRTPTQDVFFILNELVEVAVRAMSPGVNDPFTAMQCIDWLSAALVQLSQRDLPGRCRRDEEGRICIITTEVTLQQFVDVALRQLIPYIKDDPNVTRYFIQSMNRTLDISTVGELNEWIQAAIFELENQAGRQTS